MKIKSIQLVNVFPLRPSQLDCYIICDIRKGFIILCRNIACINNMYQDIDVSSADSNGENLETYKDRWKM